MSAPSDITPGQQDVLDFLTSHQEVFGKCAFRVTTDRFVAVSPGVNPHGGPLGEKPSGGAQSQPVIGRAAAAFGRGGRDEGS